MATPDPARLPDAEQPKLLVLAQDIHVQLRRVQPPEFARFNVKVREFAPKKAVLAQDRSRRCWFIRVCILVACFRPEDTDYSP